MLRFALYVSDHGFGHATRMAALAEHFIRFGIFVHVRSARPDFIFQSLDRNFCAKENVSCDVGVRHGINLVPDLAATRSALFDLMSRRVEIVEREVEFLRRERIDLILADIPWLAVEAATYARIPVFAISNFDWLFIYERLFAADRSLKPLLNTIHSLYQRVDHAFRLPLSSPQSMCAFRKVEKTGLLAAWNKDYQDPRPALGLDAGTPLLACAFGGEGAMEIDLKQLCAAFPGFVVSSLSAPVSSNHIQVPAETDFSSLIRGSDVLLTKPGYSSFTEAWQAGTHIVYCPRASYPEEEILIKGLGRYPRKTCLDSLDLTARQWKGVFASIELPKSPSRVVRNSNAEVAALIIRRFLELRYPGARLRSVFDAGSNNLNYSLCREGETLPIHTAQIYTGLGTNHRFSASGQVLVKRADISSFKRSVSDFLIYDREIQSQKQVIATGIHRRMASSADLKEWFVRKWQIPYQLLSEKQEMELAWLAASTLFQPGKSLVVVDVGGFSTEFSFGQGKLDKGVNLPLGLLILRQARSEGRDVRTLIQKALFQLELPQPDRVVCIGLSALYLAKTLKHSDVFDPDDLHGQSISKKELNLLTSPISIADRNETLSNAMEPQSKDILELSATYFTLLLDKFNASEFIVCHYGISTGYNLSQASKRPKRP